jgi:uncharacterized membrane protein YfcA
MNQAYLFLFGVVVGVASGLLGIGGGIVLVPGLIWLFGFSQPEAQGTSLAVLIPPVGIFAALVYYRHGYVRLPVVGAVAAGFLVGAYLGAKLVPYAPLDWLRLAFGGVLLYVGLVFVLGPRSTRPAVALPAGVLTVLAVLGGRLLRRPRYGRPAQRPAPGEDVEYHI